MSRIEEEVERFRRQRAKYARVKNRIRKARREREARFQSEGQPMLRRYDEPATALPAGSGFVVKRQINGIDKTWPVGSVIPPTEFYAMRNHAALLSSHYVAVSDGTGVVQPRDLPPPEKPKPNPPIWLSDSPDPLQAWPETLAARTAAIGGDEPLASVQLKANHDGAQQWKRYDKALQDRTRKRLNAVSLPSNYRTV